MTIRPFTCLLLITIAAVSCNSHSTNFKKSVSTSGHDMRVKISATVNGKELADYDKIFDITGLTKAQMDSIVDHISDSLAVKSK